MIKQELITIIVPVYNVKPYLEECINSIIAQTYKHLEIILVDDGSTDGSSQLCDKYCEIDNRIKVIHKKNGGLSDSRNAGLDVMQGKYVGFIDSDDKVNEFFIESLYCKMVENKADICAGGFVAAFKNGEIRQPEKGGVISSREAICKLIENVDLHDHVCTKLFKASLFKEIRFPQGRVFEDIRTTYKVFLKASKVIIIDDCYYWYRQRGNGIARGRFNINKLQMVEAVEDLGNDLAFSNDLVIQNKVLLVAL